ncbi:mucin-2-like isoform X50 [Syngnathus acus]|uniref:mucin-2-like isoform X50 n=1 Tax=Syngnathus acus TaxID=161584 RepID=UPI001885CB25|nr:mucin-2-like isoform X50 [Syngnathus acus]
MLPALSMGTVAAMRWERVALFFLTVSVGIEVKARLVSNHVGSICSTWGREHFKTFDGDVYQFSGTCEYNLASDCHEAMQEFSVHMRREQNDGNPTVAYLVVTINDLAFRLTKEGVTVNGQIIELPYYNSGVQVENNAVYIKLQSKVGLVVMWNGDDAVMVEVDRDYANHTCGLCGDYNGDHIYNELIYNDRIISRIEFGNIHKVHNPNDDCEDPFEELEDVQAEDSCDEFRTTCNQLLISEPWSPCTQLIDPTPYLQACVQDLCSCNNRTNDTCVCSTLSEFSRQCSHAGGVPPNWRTQDFCAKQCPYNMVYEESGSPCMDTCTHQDTSSLCEDHRMDGCFCPPGTVFDDISMRGCIEQSECQCMHGRIYNSSEGYQQDKEICTCFQGRWSCEYLQGPATCAVEEGFHISTFDGKSYTFHGDCYYTLAKVESKDDSSPKFTIQAQLVPCVNQRFDTCLKALKILINNDRNNVLMFISDGTVKQNQQSITLPYQTADINIFHASSFHILLHTSFGLQIQIQHVPLMQVYVRLDESYNGKTRGLCGNYNLVVSDDMKTPQGIVEGTATSFGNAWKSSLMCRDSRERLDDPCSLSLENDLYAKHWCALLLQPNSTFEQCHSFVDPAAYYKRCTYASCNCDKSEACLCAVFSSYARACASKGVFLMDWRANVCDKYTRTCPQTQIFSYKHQRCELTCRSLSSTLQTCPSDFLPVDGCSCPEGQYLDDHSICIPKEKCPCYHNEAIIQPGKSINIKDEHCVCSNGVLHCQSWRIRSSACPPHKVYFNCSDPGSGQLGVQCAATCLNLDSDECLFGLSWQDSNDCESGCRCPDELFDDGRGYCVEKSQCPCKHDGIFYAPGTQIPNQCNTCICRSGKWQCTEEKCPGTCIIYGSGHYNTFDQRTYGFQGHCSYVAVKNKCGNKTVQDNFGVITENVPCGTTGTTCSKTVRIQLGRMEIKLSKGKYEEIELDTGNEIKYTIRTVGMYLVVESVFGMAVMWDRKTTVRILLEPQHSGEVCGLCGDFDDNEQNDFTTQGQLLVTNMLEFANSWKTGSSCPNVEVNGDPCKAAPSRHHWSKMMCGIITGKTFQPCHNTVDPLPFYENCVQDSCACDAGGDCECFCTAVGAYAQACNEAGVCVGWRTPDICPVYCDYYNNPDECRWHYNPCHQPCYKTCLNLEGVCSNPLPSLEGCYPVCPEDKPIFDEDHQICVEECEGCFYNGSRYDEYEVIYNVTDNLGMCYYAICINRTVIFGNETCATTTAAPPTTPITEGPSTTYTIPTTTPTVNYTTTVEVTRTTISTTISTEPPTTTEGMTTTKSTTVPPLSSTTNEGPITESTQPTSQATAPVVTVHTSTTEGTTTTIKSTTTPLGSTTTESPTSTTTLAGPSTTTEIPTTSTKSTTTPARPSTTTEGPTTTTKSTTTPSGPTTTTEGPTTTTTPAGPSTTTQGPTTTIKATTTPSGPSTTTEGPTTTTKSTTTPAGPSTTTEGPTTTTKSTTTPSGPITTTEGPATTTTPARPSTTTQGPTTTTKSTTTPAGPSTTTEGPTTTTKSTTTPSGPTTTTEGPTTTTTPAGPSTTTEGPTTTTKSTTTPAGPSTTTEGPTTTTKSTTTPAGPSTTTQGPATTTTPAGPSTTTQGPTTTTKSTITPAGPSTTIEGPTTTTKSTTTPAGPSTTTEGQTTTKFTTTSSGPTTTTEGPKATTTPAGPSTTTEGPTTTTKSTTTPAGPSTTTGGPTTTTKSTTTPAGPTTTTEGPTTTMGPSTTHEGPTTTSISTTTSTGPSTTTEGPTTIVISTTLLKPTTTNEGTTTPCFCVINGKHYNPGETIFDREHIGSGICLTMICSNICEIQNKTEPCWTTPLPKPTPSVPWCPEWDVLQNETFVLCNCTMARCIENNTIEIIPYECPPLKNITCANGKDPVLVYDDNVCCQQYVCDCECKGWGDPHYITFDGLYYNYQGNCTYVLMEEITPKYDLKIYVDNVYCDAIQHVTCPRSLIISYEANVFVLKTQNLIGASELEAFKDEKRLRLPYIQQDIVIFSSGIELVVKIIPLEVVITFGISDFTINLPSKNFDSNTQGQCGNCNNNQADDCMLPGGQIIQSCSLMADFWPAKDIYQPNCQIPSVIPTNEPLPPPTLIPCKPDSECDLILSSVFEECHPLVKPDDYYQGCVFDSCHVSNPTIECTSLHMYADACAQAGVCLHWRNHTTHCESDCPLDKVYKPCGTVQQPTCEDSPYKQRLDYQTEGCFCPDGMKLFNKDSNICVEECGCIDAGGIPRVFNERFEYNCQNCICEKTTKAVTCQPKVCPPPPALNCSVSGFALVNQTNPADPCCSILACRCQSNTCPHIDPECPIGFTVNIDVPEGKCCPEYTCEPKNVCVHKNGIYQLGESVPVVPCQDCVCTDLVDPTNGLLQIKCEVQQCQQLCEQGFRYAEPRTNECCGRCVQTHCLFNVSGNEQVLRQGDIWSPPNDQCEHYTCVRSGEALTAIGTRIVCPPFELSNCQPNTIQTAANGCCQICMEQEKACKPVPNKVHITHKNCRSTEELDIPYCEGSCNTYTKYSLETATLQPTCSCCKGYRSSNRTVDLLCINGDVVPYTYIHVDECRCALSDCSKTAAAPARRRRSFTLL